MIAHRKLILSAALLVGLLSVGVAAAEVHIVQMTSVDYEPRFVPAAIQIQPGDTVRWINSDPSFVDHSVMSGTGSADPLAGDAWSSTTVAYADWYEHTFQDTGVYEFFSPPYEFEGMFGSVRVGGDTGVDEPLISTSWGSVKAFFRYALPKK
ncbi:MAG: plastocyanin/azurin family copper-binding protein [Gemmatimonadota bacterium]|nr:plastocyanin/azurin family copper-binding protein [Gemmatimonadota bacterium]MDP6528393.1 plastocyanin/azurin family copper-binding protein [Gemmatimonadota bacterium]MDP6802556.1 plastocyanin/azurin family copper-binding protein [Gemmatimonadota bacterium]MDP7031819.1 plastocyanin/azurin family copper-binding protein [Gemmatimonadota bacterium]